MYDWANSAFATTVMAGFFPVFFKAYWANQANVEESTFYLGLAGGAPRKSLCLLSHSWEL